MVMKASLIRFRTHENDGLDYTVNADLQGAGFNFYIGVGFEGGDLGGIVVYGCAVGCAFVPDN